MYVTLPGGSITELVLLKSSPSNSPFIAKNNCSLSTSSVSVQLKVKLFPTFAPESAGVMTIPPDEQQ